MSSSAPRTTAVMGVARALLSTVPVRDAIDILLGEFGWDASFQALALLRGEGADEAFGRLWERLLDEPGAVGGPGV